MQPHTLSSEHTYTLNYHKHNLVLFIKKNFNYPCLILSAKLNNCSRVWQLTTHWRVCTTVLPHRAVVTCHAVYEPWTSYFRCLLLYQWNGQVSFVKKKDFTCLACGICALSCVVVARGAWARGSTGTGAGDGPGLSPLSSGAAAWSCPWRPWNPSAASCWPWQS